MKKATKSLGIGFYLFLGCVFMASHAETIRGDNEQNQKSQQEELEDFYKKWIDQDVVYIISDEERSVFNKLRTSEEKEQFIEQFWHRRDPNPVTPNNEFREEHYRRIAYANDRFTSGAPGWKTDRGTVYIIHGEPDGTEKYTYGQSYERRRNEGGGRTATFPFERWWYRHIDGMGTDIELEFVDPTGSGEFRIALTPWEKDQLLFSELGGPTTAELAGKATRRDHPYFKPYMREEYAYMSYSHKDNPFIRYETITMARAAPIVKYNDLKELVKVEVRYDNLPIRLRQDFFQLNPDQVLVPLTLELENKDLTFEVENDRHIARVGIYGVITTMSNRLVTEFEDDLILSYRSAVFEQGKLNRAVYQKTLPLRSSSRYKLDMVVRDLNSQSVGTKTTGIILPRFEGEKLGMSTLIMADHVRQIPENLSVDERFVIGDMKVRPNVRKVFSAEDRLWIYMHVYNVRIDQTSKTPTLHTQFRILKEGKLILSMTEVQGESFQFFSPQRTVLIKEIPISNLKAGKYEVEIEIQDKIGQSQISTKDTFQIQ